MAYDYDRRGTEEKTMEHYQVSGEKLRAEILGFILGHRYFSKMSMK